MKCAACHEEVDCPCYLRPPDFTKKQYEYNGVPLIACERMPAGKIFSTSLGVKEFVTAFDNAVERCREKRKGECMSKPGPFDHTAVSETTASEMERVRGRFADLLALIENVVPTSREKSLAITNLEQAAMWANKGLSHNQPEFKDVVQG